MYCIIFSGCFLCNLKTLNPNFLHNLNPNFLHNLKMNRYSAKNIQDFERKWRVATDMIIINSVQVLMRGILRKIRLFVRVRLFI